MKCVAALICLILPFLLKGQSSKWGISISPAIIAMPNWTFGIQPGVEYKINKRFLLITDITFRLGSSNTSDSLTRDKKYFRIKPELRYVFPVYKALDKCYIGLQFSHVYREFTQIYGFYYDDLPGDSVYYFDRASVHSPVNTISFQFGVIDFFSKRFSVDGFMGIGARFINTKYEDVVNPHASFRARAIDGFAITTNYEKQGKIADLQLNIGFRLTYHL